MGMAVFDEGRAEVSHAAAARELSDYARGLLTDVGIEWVAGDRIRSARRTRVLSLCLVDQAVILERVAGAAWCDIGAALGMSAGEARARYEPTVLALQSGAVADFDLGDAVVGSPSDPDPTGTAAALDAWAARGADPWETHEPRVSRALTG